MNRMPPLALVLALLVLSGCDDAEPPTAPADAPPAAGKFVVTGFELASVEGGRLYTCGLAKGGQAFCWGSDLRGQLGDGNGGDERDVPGPVSSGLGFTQMSAGFNHTCSVTRDGQAFCWGSNSDGQLGDGSLEDRHVPVPVSGGHAFVQLSTGGSHTCGVTKGGQALCWGDNFSGQLGNDDRPNDSAVPAAVSGGFTFVHLGVGGFHACGVTKQIGTWCWGTNNAGQIGNGNAPDPAAGPSPVAEP